MRNKCKDCKSTNECPKRRVHTGDLEPWRLGTKLPMGCFEKKPRRVTVTGPVDCPFRRSLVHRGTHYAHGCSVGVNGAQCRMKGFPENCPLGTEDVEVTRQ